MGEIKIGVCGASVDLKDEVLKRSFRLGKAIADNSCVLIMGAGRGYPKEAAKGCFENKGKVIGISPAKDKSEHLDLYGFNLDYFSEVDYTGVGIPKRNYNIIEESDAIVIIGGQIGTLNEFTIAYHLGKVIGVLEGSGGVTPLLPEISKVCNKDDENDKVVFSNDPKLLINKILEKL